jgi:predicted glycosyltransferase
MTRLLFYVQHLLGIGHQRRAATVTRALARAGFEVTLISGGHEIPGLDLGGARLVQLPPTRATDLYFKNLVDEDDRPIDEAWKRRRINMLLDAWRAADPDVLLFELFPFGRRQMRFELLPLLEAATAADRRRPLIVSSVRDILVGQHKLERNDEMVALVERWFDKVLVHGDPTLVPFERTFPHAARIRDRLHYTGYVVDETGRKGPPGSPGDGEVLVSAGGGAVGEALLRAAIEARPLSMARDLPWRVLVGIKVDDAIFDALVALAPAGVIVERARGDFPSLLMNGRLSISQGGYNTVMEVLAAHIRAVVVPYAGGIETEQTLRARLLAQSGRLELVDETAMTPTVIAAAIDRALTGPPPSAAGLDTNGAAESARLLRTWLAERDQLAQQPLRH